MPSNRLLSLYPYIQLILITTSTISFLISTDVHCSDEFTSDKLKFKENRGECSSSTSQGFQSEVRNSLRTHNSAQDENRWRRTRYFDEQSEGFIWLIQDESFDARLSNLAEAISSFRLVNINFHSTNMGNSRINKHYNQLAAGSRVDDKLCGQDLSDMLNLISEMEAIVESKRLNSSSQLDERHFKLAQVLDSFGRFQAGVLVGRHIFEGSFSQCSGLKMILGGETLREVGTRYCVAKLKIDRYLHPILKSRVKTEQEDDALLSTAICIPETCHMKSFHANKQLLQSLVDGQFKLPKSMFIEENRELDSIFCSPDSDSQLGSLSTPGKLFIFVLLSWLTLALYATFRDKSKDNEQPNSTLQRVFECVDLEKSWQDFTCQNERVHSNARVNLNTMNSVKVLIGAFVVLGHCFMISITSIMDPAKAYNTLEHDPLMFALLNATLVVDTMYVITGILMAYITMKKFHSGGNTESGQFSMSQLATRSIGITLSRYVRLMPLLVIVFWFKKSIFVHLGSGPAWDYGLNKETHFGACRLESWLSPFTFQAAYTPISRQCLPQTWSVMGDMLFSIISAPLIILMTIKPKLSVSLAAILSLASNFALIRSLNNINPDTRADLEQLRFHAMGEVSRHKSQLYTAPHYRVFSVLVGVLAGFALHHYESSGKLKKWPLWFEGIATKISLAFVIVSLPIGAIVPILKSEILEPYGFHQSLFRDSIAVGKLLWALSNAVLLLRMVTDWKDCFLMKNSAGVFWKSMVKLNYSTLLVHMDLLIYEAQMQTETHNYSRYRMLTSFASCYLFCLLIGLVLYLLIENPINKLIKEFLKLMDLIGDKQREKSRRDMIKED